MDQDLRTILRELLDEGRQLGITRGTEDNVVARYTGRVEALYAPLRGEISKLKGQLRSARKAASDGAKRAS